MDKIRLGRTGLMVSKIGFGGIPIQRLTETDAVKVVKKCLDLGITYIDTANAYTTSEARIGKATKGKRQDYIIATKSGARTKEGVEQHLANSLKMLGTDYIDLYQFHGVNDAKNLEMVLAPNGPLTVVEKAVKDGVIKHFGITCHSNDIAKEAVKTDKFATMMFPFNFITSEPADDLLPLCRKHDVGFIAMKPLAGGMLDNATIAFKYLLQFPDVVPLVGIEKTSEIEEIVGLLDKPIKMTPAEKRTMQSMIKELGTKFCRRCDYCQPCTMQIPISTVMNSASFAKRLPPERVFTGWLADAMEKAYDCSECGECETRCPFNLSIREVIKERADWFKEAKAEFQKSSAK
ncbi:MAG: aldo/keto reductase [Dehalococcoidales bacterium]|nr:aldo/keto reductase [Dehalococcoidales bacterium]